MTATMPAADPAVARDHYRAGLAVPSSGWAPGYTQANLVVVPQDWAYDVLLFGQRNPKPVPLLDVTDAGSTSTALAPGADLRTDLPRYRVWQDGELVDEPTRCWTRVCRCATSSRAATFPCSAPTGRAAPPAGCPGRWWCRCGRCPASWWPPRCR